MATKLSHYGESIRKAREAAGSVGKWSWDTPPEPIPEDQILETIETDVLIIGAGNAGVHAALSCAENGLDVVVIEKSATVNARGGSTGSCESHLHREADIHVNRERAQYLWVRSSGNRCNEKLVTLWFDRSGEALDWMWNNLKSVDPGATQQLISAWGKFEWFPEEPDNCFTKVGPDFEVDDEVYSINLYGRKFFYAPTAAHYKICKEKYHVPFYFKTAAEQLIQEDGRVIGCIATTEEGYKKFIGNTAVVLCTGDISGDPEMMACYAEDFIENVHTYAYSPRGINTGDGHKMAMWAGAAMQAKPFPPILHPQAIALFHGPFMSVNMNGERYTNEATWVQGKAASYMMQPGHICYAIFDANYGADTVDSLQYGGGMFWDSLSGVEGEPFDLEAQKKEIQKYLDAGKAFVADTLEELADIIGVNKENFLAQVERYNADCEAGVDTEFHKDPRMMYPIKEPPFYATKCGAALLAVAGGIKINERMQCLDAEGNVIPGLYASGNASGDLYAQDYPIHVSGTSTSRCLTWGYLLGRYLAGVE